MITFDKLDLPEAAPLFDPEAAYTALLPGWYSSEEDLSRIVKYQVLIQSQDTGELFITDNEFMSRLADEDGPSIICGIVREMFMVTGFDEEDEELELITMDKGGDYLATHTSEALLMVDGITPLRKLLAQQRMDSFIKPLLG